MRRTFTPISLAGWAFAMVAALELLSACGSSSSPGPASAVAKTRKVHNQASTDPAERPVADMVAGVSPSRTGPPVALKFELRELPQVGQLLDVDIAVLPSAPTISRIYGKFQSTDGLQLVEGGELPAIEKPTVGSTIRHVVRVLPKQDGIFTVSAIVSVDLSDDAITRTYSIPVIVGEGLREQTARTEVAEGRPAPGTAVKTH